MGMSTVTRLYVNMEADGLTDQSFLPKRVLESYWENRRLHEESDDVKEKSIRFVHGEQFTPEVELERANAGLPSISADKTLSVWRTLDGYARNNKIDINFVPVGNDDFEKADTHNKIYNHVRNTRQLHEIHSEAYALAAITDEAFVGVFPQINSNGQLDPDFVLYDAFECYPDPNSKDPIYMRDAQMIDVPTRINPMEIKDKYGDLMSKEFAARLEAYSPSQTFEDKRTNEVSLDRSFQTREESNGTVLLLTRYYKKTTKKRFLINPQNQHVVELTGRDKRIITKKLAEEQGYKILDLPVEELWTCVLIPAVTYDFFVYNEPADFQPINPLKLGEVNWPVVRYVFNNVANKAIGAIRNIIPLQEARNLIISALLHHIQTAANGGLFYENTAFNGDTDEETKFKTRRNRAGYSGKVADGALKEGRIGNVPQGETAFKDGGDFLESILMDVIKDISGAEPVMKGQAQSGSPAALFNLQIQQSQQQLLGSQAYFTQSQYLMADLIYAFERQFWTESRVLLIEGGPGKPPERFEINEQTMAGEILNDPSYGLFTVYKTSEPRTETQRRKALADSLDVATALGQIGLPAFAQDLEHIVNSLPVSPEVRESMMQKIKQWQAIQGIRDETALQLEQAQAQQAQMTNLQGQAAPMIPA